jgi:hypothetical protein
MIGFIASSIAITNNYDSSESMTASDSLHFLLDYECLLFHCDWLGSDLRIGHLCNSPFPLVNTPHLNTQPLNSLTTELLNSLTSLSLMLRPTVSRPVCPGIKHPSGAYDQIFITCVTVTVLFLWGALSVERSGLSFVCAAGPCQRSLSLVRVPWDLRPYFTVSDLRLPFSSPPTARKLPYEWTRLSFYNSGRTEYRSPSQTVPLLLSVLFVALKRA